MVMVEQRAERVQLALETHYTMLSRQPCSLVLGRTFDESGDGQGRVTGEQSHSSQLHQRGAMAPVLRHAHGFAVFGCAQRRVYAAPALTGPAACLDEPCARVTLPGVGPGRRAQQRGRLRPV
jgi:hypothetical protein